MREIIDYDSHGIAIVSPFNFIGMTINEFLNSDERNFNKFWNFDWGKKSYLKKFKCGMSNNSAFVYTEKSTENTNNIIIGQIYKYKDKIYNF